MASCDWKPINRLQLLVKAFIEAAKEPEQVSSSPSPPQPPPPPPLSSAASSDSRLTDPSSPRRPPSTPPSSSPDPALSPAPSPAPSPHPAPAPSLPLAPAPRAKKDCPDCGKSFSSKNIADHRKVHLMEGEEGAQAKGCKQCAKHPERCRVAKYPKKTGTFACSCCLKGHKRCEYTGIKLLLGASPESGDRPHPKLSRQLRPWEL